MKIQNHTYRCSSPHWSILRGALIPLGVATMAAAGPWVPPIGIPPPPFGIAEKAPPMPVPWDAPVQGFYCVEPTHPNSTDTSNPYGTPAKPRKSIPGTEASPLPPGSVVEVRGRYDRNHTSPSDFQADGTAARPVFIRGRDGSPKPIFTGRFDVVGSSYVVIENIEFADRDGDLAGGDVGRFAVTDKNGRRYDSDHIVLRHCELRGNLAGGGAAAGGYAAASVVSDIVFYQNNIHDNGNVNADFDQDVHGLTVGGNTHHVWILDNEFARNSGDGVQINGYGMPDPGLLNHIYVGRNVSHHNKQTGLWTKTAADVIFSMNVVHGHRVSNSSLGAGMGFQYAPERVWFLFNKSHDNEIGIGSASDSTVFGANIYLVGNVIYNIHRSGGVAATGSGWDPAGITLVGGTNRYVVNNTIHDVDAGINTPTSAALFLSNNIVSGVTQTRGRHVCIENPGTWEMKNCLFYQNGAAARIRIGSTVYSAPQLAAAFSKVKGCMTADPLFANPTAGDFRLQATSPAVDTAVEDAVYATFERLYGLNIRVDFAGIARPEGPAADIGAHELRKKPDRPGAPKVEPIRPSGLE